MAAVVPTAVLLERLIVVVRGVAVAVAEGIVVVGLIDKSSLLVPEVAEAVACVIASINVIVVGLWEVIVVDWVLALLVTEVMGKNVVALVVVALVIAVLLMVTVSDLVV